MLLTRSQKPHKHFGACVRSNAKRCNYKLQPEYLTDGSICLHRNAFTNYILTLKHWALGVCRSHHIHILGNQLYYYKLFFTKNVTEFSRTCSLIK